MTPLDDQQVSDLDQATYQRLLSQFQGEWVARLNVDQMFVLIDGVLPFEACLYYQVLPLFLEGNRLHLGMVSPDDSSASEYVRRIISYLNYSLVSHAISSEALRVVLTAYLNHAGSQSARRESVSFGHYRHSSRSQSRNTDPNERLTLVVDSPDDLYSPGGNDPAVGPLTPPPIAASPSEVSAPSQRVDSGGAINSTGGTNGSNPAPHQTSFVPSEASPAQPPAPYLETPWPPFQPREVEPSVGQPLPILHINAQHLESSADLLASLSPPELLQELLARILLGGIGRLYFESYPQYGRIVWSQNGVLQSVLDRLELPLFQGVIRELKTMANLSLTPLTQARQMEMEYLHDRTNVLLRFRFMPSQHGEEATLQVLRGAALKFYQQQQINRLEKDALNIARQLQNKLNEIRAKAYSDPKLAEVRLDSLPKLLELLQAMEQELSGPEQF